MVRVVPTLLLQLALCIALLFPDVVMAEKARALREGNYRHWFEGRLVFVGADTLLIRKSPPDTFFLSDLGVVEISQGSRVRPANVIAGTLLGSMVGAIVVMFGGCAGGRCEGDAGIGALGGFVLGAALGAPFGLVIGLQRVDSWKRIHMSEAARQWRLESWP